MRALFPGIPLRRVQSSQQFPNLVCTPKSQDGKTSPGFALLACRCGLCRTKVQRDNLTCQGAMQKRRGYGCRDESLTVYLPLFTVCIRPRGFGFMLPVKPRNVNQSQFKQTGGITVTQASLFRLLAASLGQGSFATWTLACTQKNAEASASSRSVIRNSDVAAIPRHCSVSLPPQTFAGGADPARPQSANTFFPSYRRLLNSCTALLFTDFHIYPHTAWHIPSPSPPIPCWFRSCPFLSGFYPKASVGDRIISRVVINCISYFLLFHLHCASRTVGWAPVLWDPGGL